MQYCCQLKGLSIKLKASCNDGNETAAFAQSVHKLPLLECHSLEGASIGKEDTITLMTTLFKKRSMKELDLWDSSVSKEAVSIFVDALKVTRITVSPTLIFSFGNKV
jgi:hypothetical protein